MAQLVNTTRGSPQAMQVRGLHGACLVRDVASALSSIGATLSGDSAVIEITSGTQGYCAGPIGAVATHEQKSAVRCGPLAPRQAEDGKPVAIGVHDFNSGHRDASN